MSHAAAAVLMAIALPRSAPGAPADGAAQTASAGVWEELSRQRAGPLALAGASWFEPPGAAFLAVESAGDGPPTVWRVATGADGSATSRVELVLTGPVRDRWTVWIPPSPSVPHAVIADGGVRAFTFHAHDGDRALARWHRESWRWAGTAIGPPPEAPPIPGAARLREQLLDIAGDAGDDRPDRLRHTLLTGRGRLLEGGTAYLPGLWLSPSWLAVDEGQPAPIAATGTGRLRLLARPTEAGPHPDAVTVFDLLLHRSDDGPWARLPSSALVRATVPGAVPTAARELEVQLAPGEGPAVASVLGSAAELRGRLYRPRALLPAPPDGVLLAGLAPGGSALVDRSRVAVDDRMARGTSAPPRSWWGAGCPTGPATPRPSRGR
jgi:hypothetical protein